MEPTRRDVLRVGGLSVLGAAGVAALPWGSTLGASVPSRLDPARMPTPFRTGFVVPPVLRPYRTTRDADGGWVDHFGVTERHGRANILPGGLSTDIWGYNGLLGGPTIKVRRGRRAVVRVRNHLPPRHPTLGHEFTTSLHLHGSASLPQYDGYASDVTPPGFYKEYHFPNLQHGRTLWYHDHGVHHTAPNVYTGLFAQYHMHDHDEGALLPQGRFDVPLTVGDAMFAADGSLAYDDNSTSGLWGDVILVNGRPWPVMKVQRRVYRFRILNASISRSYRFQLGDGEPVTMVCTDAGLMPRAQTVTQWRHGNAERYEVLVDFSRFRPGQRVVLRNLSNPNNHDYRHTDKVVAFDVTDEPVDRRDPTWNRIPDTLVTAEVMDLRPSDAARTRRLEFKRHNGQWTINGQTWQDVIDSNYERIIADPGLDDVEIWEIANPHGGWFHPVHIHLVDFQILSRNGRPPYAWERGPKDVVYVGENETVQVIMRFAPHRGRYMVHCHNLPHEDHDMMVQFGVGWRPGQPDDNNPVLAAPCSVDNLPANAEAVVATAAPRPAVDRRRPGVLRRSPRPGARHVRRRASIVVDLDQPVVGISRRTVRLRRTGGRRVPVRLRYDERTGRLVITPRHRLAPRTGYTVRLTRGIRDRAGNRLAPTVWRFRTRR